MKDNRTRKRKVGDVGENITCRFLVKHGFRIIGRNYLRKWGEIDIIAQKDKKLHFIEVKTVSHPYVSRETGDLDQYRPEDNIHPWKLRRLARVIQTYLLNVSYKTDWQLDIVVVYLDFMTKKAQINHLEDIVL
ncbi:MAG: YraN family protein [Candidatus Paceibacterota bacterium]